MRATVITCVISIVFEFCLWLPVVWRYRHKYSLLTILMVVVCSAIACLQLLNIWGALLLFFGAYRIINLARVAKDRTQPDYLFHAARRSSISFITLTIVILVLAGISQRHDYLPGLSGWYILAVTQFASALFICFVTVLQVRATKPPTIIRAIAHRELPSLTVAIPARNETDDLEACLASLLKSTYPKLEIIVLDDCSQDNRTPEIIRGLAHDGVRFISGEPPPEYWLAKNYAYSQLAEQASGDILLFCGVDCRFEPDSLINLVQTMLEKDKRLLSILPRNAETSSRQFEPMLIQPVRYAWELAIPRDWSRRPPVLSTCWLIYKHTLSAAGGFEAFTRSSLPERQFARLCAGKKTYSFYQSNQALGVSTVKTVAEQQATALRMRYPQLRRRPQGVALISIAEIVLFIMPPSLAIAAIINHLWILTILGGATQLLLIIFYASIIKLTYRRFLWRSLIAFPLAAIYDIGLVNCSMWQYEFNEVIWKGRNVCVPVMRVINSLPKAL